MTKSCRLVIALLGILASPVTGRAQTGDDLAALSDEFSDPSRLAEWRRHHEAEGWSNKLKVLEVGSRPGLLHLEPWPSVWYYDYTAPFLFKEIEGDFMVTTRLRVSGEEDEYPQTIYSLAGLMVRRPRTEAPFASEDRWQKDREDYVFVVTGTTGEPGKPFIETKSAVRSMPLVKHYPIDRTGWVELRIARISHSILILYRFEEGEWMPHERIYRPDLPRRLQVGLMAYGDFATIREHHWYRPWEYNTRVIRDGKEDLRVEVDWIRFRRVAPSSEAAARVRPERIEWDDHRISDEELLRLLPFLAHGGEPDVTNPGSKGSSAP